MIASQSLQQGLLHKGDRLATQNSLIFQLCFIMLKIKLNVCGILCENFIQIGQKMKKL